MAGVSTRRTAPNCTPCASTSPAISGDSKSIIAAPGFRKLGGLKGDKLSRVPRGFAKDHPAAAHLMRKQFLGFREEPAAFAARPDFYRQLVRTFTALTPLVRFLNEPLVNMLKMERRGHILRE